MTDWDSLKLRFPIQVLPRNVQDIRLDCSSYDLKTSDLILCLTRRSAIDPGSVRNNGFFLWLHRVYAVEANVRTRRPRSWPIAFQKYCQNLNRLQRDLCRIGEFQEDPRSSIDEPDDERRSTIAACCHKFIACSRHLPLSNQGSSLPNIEYFQDLSALMYNWSSGTSVRQHTYEELAIPDLRIHKRPSAQKARLFLATIPTDDYPFM